MRDPKRIDGYMKRLGDVWKDYPDFRFGQLLINLLGNVQDEVGMDLFFVEDDKFFEAFEKCYARMMGKEDVCDEGKKDY